MTAPLDCVLCLIRQALESVRFATKDELVHAAVLQKTLDVIREKGFSSASPLLAQEVHRLVRQETGIPDPYAALKKEANTIMLSLQDSLREQIRQSNDSLLFAAKVAIAGNSIDYAVRGDWNKNFLLQTMEQTLQRFSLKGDVERFVKAITEAKQVLYLLDNCGEIVCDLLLIEEIKRLRPDINIVAVVRGSAVLNDVTREDAQQTGLDKIVPVIDNSNDAVGTVLEQCGAEFMEMFAKADTIIAKGLANYETLAEYDSEQLPQTVCFLFRAKCPVIAKRVNVAINDLVVHMRNRGT